MTKEQQNKTNQSQPALQSSCWTSMKPSDLILERLSYIMLSATTMSSARIPCVQHVVTFVRCWQGLQWPSLKSNTQHILSPKWVIKLCQIMTSATEWYRGHSGIIDARMIWCCFGQCNLFIYELNTLYSRGFYSLFDAFILCLKCTWCVLSKSREDEKNSQRMLYLRRHALQCCTQGIRAGFCK